MSTNRLVIALALSCGVAALAAGCGGSGSNSSSSSSSSSGSGQGVVARVGPARITQAQLDQTMKGAESQYKAQGQTFPAVGSPTYQQIEDKALALLVQRAEYEQKAKTLGITVTPKQVDEQLAQLKKRPPFNGSEKRYQEALKQQGFTDEQVRNEIIRPSLITQALYTKAEAGITVSPAEEKAYYQQHLDQYVAQQESRDVRHILVKSKSEADKLYNQLRHGASFAALAKKYSLDPGSKNVGGELTDTRGAFVAPFETVAFSLRTGQISKPVRSKYGWHIIQALKPTKPRRVTPFAKVQTKIQQLLLAQKQSAAVSDWAKGVAKEFCSGKLSYSKGFQPDPDPCASLK